MEKTPPQKVVERKTSGDINQEEHSINYLSPFVSISRGKVSSRKEKEKRNTVYLDTPPSSSKAKNLQEKSLQLNELSTSQLPIEVRRTLEAVRYFRKQVECEIYRLHALCDEWEMYKLENLSHLEKTGGDDMINATIGQTKLLTSKKFIQFKELIDRCEANAYGVGPQDDGSEKTKLITSVDLEGFWTMLGLQTENLAKRFDNLNRWKENNWNDPDEIKKTKKQKNIKVKENTKETTAAVTKSKVNNALQEMKREKYAELCKKQNDEVAPKSQDTLVAVDVVQSKTIITPSVASNETSVKTMSTTSLFRRRSLSASPSLMYKKKNKKDEYKELRKNVLVTNLANKDLEITPVKCDKPVAFCSERKSILKTPGTNNGKEKSVIFGRKLHIRNFNFIDSNDEDMSIEETEFTTIINQNKSVNDKDENSDSYNLRNRKVVKRASCEIVIPK